MAKQQKTSMNNKFFYILLAILLVGILFILNKKQVEDVNSRVAQEAPQVTEVNQVTQVQKEKPKFSVISPIGWKRSPIVNKEVLEGYQLISPGYKVLEGGDGRAVTAGAHISIGAYPAKYKDLESYKSAVSPLAMRNSVYTQVAGVGALRGECGDVENQVCVVFIKDGVHYSLYLFPSDSGYISVFEDVLNSFEFN